MTMDINKEYLQLLHLTREYLDMEINYAGKFAMLENPIVELASSIQPAQQSGMQMTPEEKEQQLATLQKQANGCFKCKLAQGRKQVVFGSGSANAQLVIVGEAPGFYEDQQGVPFVGDAGKLLTKMLASIHINRQNAYICNVIKCRPPKNRNPEAEEIVSCRPWLQEQLAIIRPLLICSMGKFAAEFLTGIEQSMWKYRGETYEYEGIPVICTYHPAYLLRNPDDKRKAWEDLKRLRKMLDERLATT